jgi:hypothetical protein
MIEYLKENAMEDMKIELSKMKSEYESINKKNLEIYQDVVSSKEFKRLDYIDVKDLPRDIAILEDFIEITERIELHRKNKKNG